VFGSTEMCVFLLIGKFLLFVGKPPVTATLEKVETGRFFLCFSSFHHLGQPTGGKTDHLWKIPDPRCGAVWWAGGRVSDHLPLSCTFFDPPVHLPLSAVLNSPDGAHRAHGF